MLRFAFLMIAAWNMYHIYYMIKRDRYWKRRFAELNSVPPKSTMLLGHFLKVFVAAVAAWTLAIAIRGI